MADGGRDRSLSAPEVHASSVAGTEASCVRGAPAGWPHHDWFEGRGPRCVLMASIDDALSLVFAPFYAYEGTIPVMDSVGRYVRQ